MKPRTALLSGLLLGGLTSLAYLVVPVSVYVTAVAWVLLLSGSPRRPAVAGGSVAAGAVWLLLIGRATWSCWADLSCTQPGFVWVWFAPGLILLAIGLVLVVSGRTRLPEG